MSVSFTKVYNMDELMIYNIHDDDKKNLEGELESRGCRLFGEIERKRSKVHVTWTCSNEVTQEDFDNIVLIAFPIVASEVSKAVNGRLGDIRVKGEGYDFQIKTNILPPYATPAVKSQVKPSCVATRVS